jgi:hypothetical protein
MSVALKIEKKEKNDRSSFRVKFNTNDHRKSANNHKEMILGGHTRTIRDFNSFTSGTAIKSREVDSYSESES